MIFISTRYGIPRDVGTICSDIGNYKIIRTRNVDFFNSEIIDDEPFGLCSDGSSHSDIIDTGCRNLELFDNLYIIGRVNDVLSYDGAFVSFSHKVFVYNAISIFCRLIIHTNHRRYLVFLAAFEANRTRDFGGKSTHEEHEVVSVVSLRINGAGIRVLIMYLPAVNMGAFIFRPTILLGRSTATGKIFEAFDIRVTGSNADNVGAISLY